MDPRTSGQDLMRCGLCTTAVVQMHCDTCITSLCVDCVGKHMISDESRDHKVVKFQSRRSTLLYPRCTSHDKEQCEMYCNQCEIPICTACIASEAHTGHKIHQILTVYNGKIKEIETEKEELKEKIYPSYLNIAADVQSRISQLEKEYGDLASAITRHGEYIKKEIEKLVEKLKGDVSVMKDTHYDSLKKYMTEINPRISEIDETIKAYSKLLQSNDILQVFQFKIKSSEFKKIPCKMDALPPCFTPVFCKAEQLINLFGEITTLSSISSEHPYSTHISEKSLEAGYIPPVKQLLDEPETVDTINIDNGGNGNTVNLFCISQGLVVKSVKTRSGKTPNDIAVTDSGDLVYTDSSDKTVNIVKNEKIEEVIKFQNWIPYGVCITASSDLLVTLSNNDKKETKVVRYSDSQEQQTIQFDDKDKPLFSYGTYYIYITENKNQDICVADSGAKALVVVNQAGKLRFSNQCVHVINKDGQFLKNIQYGLSYPFGLCIDSNDNLFVAQYRQVKKIKYLQ
ncbi:uncharacterized protein LOC133175593 [Saccostrea echinata]|uniref:uncharacterized protein LOC133175593 n=1 Tax=Saccostrea echinata TaxID=191078 RepID=UPI002A8288D1|nr:uncharacterized protein LOC133175593 [Saccostrea echinata]